MLWIFFIALARENPFIDDIYMKKLFWFTFIAIAFVTACGKGAGPENGQNPEGEVSIVVATFNVLKPANRITEMSMDNPIVRKALAGTIASAKADLIGFNEVDETHIPGGKYSLQAMCASIKNYQWSLQWPNRSDAEGKNLKYNYADGFAYNSATLELEECGYVWLSKEEDTWYTNPADAYQKCGNPERTCLWVRFKHIASGKIFWAFPTHLPHPDHGGALNMAKVVNRFAAEKAGDAPAIIFGDMNSSRSHEPDVYNTLISYWRDGNINARWGTMSGSSDKYYYPWETYSGGHPERRIDHILTKGCSASNFRRIIVTYPIDDVQWYPSDHLAITATVKL